MLGTLFKAGRQKKRLKESRASPDSSPDIGSSDESNYAATPWSRSSIQQPEIQEIENEEEGSRELASWGVPAATRTGVAVAPNSPDALILKWALENSVEQAGDPQIILVYVRAPLRTIPNPLGGHVPISLVSTEKLAEYMTLHEAQTEQFRQDLQNICAFHKVKADFVLVESDQVAKSLVEQIQKYQLTKFVLGASRQRLVKIRTGTSGYVLKHAPDYCTVQCVSKTCTVVSSKEAYASPPSTPTSGRLSKASSKALGNALSRFLIGDSDDMQPEHSASLLSPENAGPHGTMLQPLPLLRSSSVSEHSRFPLLLQEQRNDSENNGHVTSLLERSCEAPQGLNVLDQNCLQPEELEHESQAPVGYTNVYLAKGKRLEVTVPSPVSSVASSSCTREMADESEVDNTEGGDKAGVSEELDMLKQQLQKAMLDVAKAEAAAEIEAARCLAAREAACWAMRKAEEMTALRLEEARQREAAAEMARKRLEEEEKRCAEALKIAESMRKALEEEVRKRQETEDKIVQEAEARKAAMQRPQERYTEFSFEELQAATNNFSPRNKLGEGGYGPVYKGRLHHTTVAIKVLRQDGCQGPDEFQLEVEVLSRLHHPHIVLLLGCCSERGCIVYEYLENGSLEDRLFCKGDSLPIPWFTRFRVAAEVAIALLFLHNANPQPIVHRDLKPANILLDRNYNSKISDVGLARFIPSLATSVVDTSPVGTFAYIDPEYQRGGAVGPKSDVYAFGIILLQLLTATSPLGVVTRVANAVDLGSFKEILDPSAGDWPLAEAMQVACLGLSCAEMERKNRPDLESVLELLEKMKETLQNEDYEQGNPVAPTIFLCPILQEVLEYPVIAADGHTYEYEAIRCWLEDHDTSPMTNVKLPHKNLTANRLIRSAICEWKAKAKHPI